MRSSSRVTDIGGSDSPTARLEEHKMKNQLIHNFSLVLLVAVNTPAGESQIRVQIPFAFHVGESLLSAGEYTVETGAALLRLRSVDSKTSLTIICNSVQSLTAPSQDNLVFSKYGDEFFLFQVWKADISRGQEFRRSRREIELASSALRGFGPLMAGK
jgi:hypothetical protein